MDIFSKKFRTLSPGQYASKILDVREVPSKFEGSPSRLEVSFGIEGADRPVRAWMDPHLDSEAAFGRLVSALGFDPNAYGAEPLNTEMLVGRRCEIVLELIERAERSWLEPVDFHPAKKAVPNGTNDIPF